MKTAQQATWLLAALLPWFLLGRAAQDGTPAEGAELVLETEPGYFNCAICGELELDRLRFACPHCDGPLKLLRAGRGLMITEVEPIVS